MDVPQYSVFRRPERTKLWVGSRRLANRFTQTTKKHGIFTAVIYVQGRFTTLVFSTSAATRCLRETPTRDRLLGSTPTYVIRVQNVVSLRADVQEAFGKSGISLVQAPLAA